MRRFARNTLGCALCMPLAAGAAGASCNDIIATYEHELDIQFSQPVVCFDAYSYAAAGFTSLVTTPMGGCGIQYCNVPCAANDIVSQAVLDPDTDQDCATSASASACDAYAQASTSTTSLYAFVSGTMTMSPRCGILSIPMYTIAAPYLLADPASLNGVTYTITLRSEVDVDARGDQHGTAVVLGDTVAYVIHTLRGVRTSPGVVYDPITGEYTATIKPTAFPASGELRPFFIMFDKRTFDYDGNHAFTQLDLDALALDIPLAVTEELLPYDVNQDGAIDSDDLDTLQALLDAGAGSCVGDANGDLAVNNTDLNLILAYQGQLAQDAESIAADVNDDGVVDSDDLSVFLSPIASPCD